MTCTKKNVKVFVRNSRVCDLETCQTYTDMGSRENQESSGCTCCRRDQKFQNDEGVRSDDDGVMTRESSPMMMTEQSLTRGTM